MNKSGDRISATKGYQPEGDLGEAIEQAPTPTTAGRVRGPGQPHPPVGASLLSPIRRKGTGSAMETIYTFFLNYEQYIILLTICFFAGMAWRHHRLISRLFIIAASCLWVIYVYRYQIAVGWPALDASGELSLRELLSDGAFIRHWSSLLSAAALGGALGVAFL